MGEVCGKHGEKQIAYRILVLLRKTEGQGVFRTKNNIGGSKEMWCEEMEWLYLAQRRNDWLTLLKMAVNNRLP
jgi:hypothetical protein